MRGETFVTRKITRGLARIKLGIQDKLYLGNLDALRDWGHARDYVEMTWLMLQQETAEDFVIASGEQHTVREFVTLAAEAIGIHLAWSGKGVHETAVDQSGAVVVAVDPDISGQRRWTACWEMPAMPVNVSDGRPRYTFRT